MRPARSAPPVAPSRSPWLERTAERLWQLDSFRMVPDLVLDEPPTGSCAPAPPGAIRVAFTGFPSHYSVAILLALLTTEVDLVGLVTSPGAHPVVAGRNALGQVAEHLGVPLLRLDRVNDPGAVGQLQALEADLFLVASFNQILHQGALRLGRLGWLNVHPSLLPAYRGPEPVYWAIVNGEPTTGVTFQRIAREIDLGPALWQESEPILADDTNGTLSRRLTARAARALPQVIARAIAEDPGRPLDPEGGSYYTSVGHRRLEQAPSASVAGRWVRAGNPNMPAAAEVDGTVRLVLEARPAVAHDPDRQAPRLHYADADLVLLRTEPAPA
ncbi:MAG TPA: formyltransferase family protein [Verrucomicrobiae bacterium]|nr:formyltransferase family protein [Verrucomicrobiae bacterium]